MISYRKDLDGLRALAVTAVIIYHADINIFGFPIFQGGFFGVDIFFVLSGYLITEILRKQISEETFSFLDFYWRRTKRIVPAMAIVLFATSLLAYRFLLPDDLVTYARSLKSALYFGSNHFFYGEDSYTAAASIYRPLLHTWSLSVEWQFYMVYPFIILFSIRYLPKYLYQILWITTLASFSLTVIVVDTKPDMAFYLLPTRVWEFTLGGLCGVYLERKRSSNNPVDTTLNSICQFFPTIGLCTIIFSMVLIDHDLSHPSFTTLLPVVGTLLIITFPQENQLSYRILTIKPIVNIGLISYSIYLWHQPIFVFFRLIVSEVIKIHHLVILFAVTVMFSTITYLIIESPFRRKNLGNTRIASLAIIYFIMILFSILTIRNEGFPSRYGVLLDVFHGLNDKKTHKIDNVRCHSQPFEKSCKIINENNILLLGDSHAGGLGKHVYSKATKSNLGYLNFTPSGCIAIDGLTTKTIKNENVVDNLGCAIESKKISEYIENESSPRFTIIYMTRLPLYLNGTRFDNKLGGKELGSKYWVEAKNQSAESIIIDKLNLWHSLGHNLVLIYPVPEMGWNVQKQIQKRLSNYELFSKEMASEYKKIEISIPYSTYKDRTKSAFSVLDKVKGNNIIRVYPHKLLCDKNKCIANNDTNLLYYDDNHLSTHGAKLLVDDIFTKIQ